MLNWPPGVQGAVLYENSGYTGGWQAPLQAGNYATLAAPAVSDQASAVSVFYVGVDTCTTGKWTDCAFEGKSCACTGQVRFGQQQGTLANWVYRDAPGSMDCTVDAMGGADPAPSAVPAR